MATPEEEVPEPILPENKLVQKRHFNKVLQAKKGDNIKDSVSAVIPDKTMLWDGDIHISVLVVSELDKTALSDAQKKTLVANAEQEIRLNTNLE